MITPYCNAVNRRYFDLPELAWAEERIATWDSTSCAEVITEADGRITCLLHITLAKKKIDIIKELFSAGVISSQTHRAFSRGDGTYLHVALFERFKEAVQIFCQNHNVMEVRDYRGYTPLMFAADMSSASVELIHVLLEGGADVHAEFDGTTALILAAQADSNLEIVNMLLNAGSDVAKSDSMGKTALLKAAERGCNTIIEVLLEAGADIDHPDNQGKTPLCKAAEYGYTQTVKFLIEAGADINKKDIEGWPILFRSMEYGRGNVDTIKALLQGGARINDHIGYVPLYSRDPPIENFTLAHLAARNCREETLRDLVNTGLIMNAKTKCGQTPLHFASMRALLSNMSFLIDQCGADVNAMDASFQTPLSSIRKYSEDLIPAIMLLLQHGAQPNADTILLTFNKCYPEKDSDVLPVLECLLRASPKAGTMEKCANGLTVLESIIQTEKYERTMWKFGGNQLINQIIVKFLIHGSRCWDVVPVPCSGIGLLFPLLHEEEELHQVFKRLYPSQQFIIRFILLCMNRINLPKPVQYSILSSLLINF